MISRLPSIILVFILVGITLSSSDVPRSRLMFEYDWPVPKKNLMRFPHPKSCFHFYLTKPDGSHVVKKCSGDEMFDYQTLQCKDRASAKCWKDVIQRIITKKQKKDFLCPFPWGLYPDIEDCSHFYECLSGTPYLRICPESMAFDKAERTCVPVKEAMCTDETDVVELGYRCPYKWGYFTHLKDCSKYYECMRKVPSIRTCKRNMLFDNLERRCIPMNNVKCGTRFNPYERNASTTESVGNNIKSNSTDHEMTDHPRTRYSKLTTERPGIGYTRDITEHPKTGYSRFNTEHPETGYSRLTTERPGTGYSRFTTERPGTGYSRLTTERPVTVYTRFITERPGTGYSRLTTSRPGTGYSRLTTERPVTVYTRDITERPGTGYSRFTTERPGTGYIRFTTERPGTAYSRLTTERPGTGYTRDITERPGNGYSRFITVNSRNVYSSFITERPETRYSKDITDQPKIEYSKVTSEHSVEQDTV